MVDFYRFDLLKRVPGCIHAVTMKAGDAPCSLSLAMHTGEPESYIIKNRELIAKALESGERLHFAIADQIHSDNIHIVTEKQTRGWVSQENAIKNCDALITAQKGVLVGILTADCVPVLLYDAKKGVAAAVHAGWKGTKAQIAVKTVKKMQEVFGSDPADIIAGIAPAIGKCCYEVGEDVAEHFFDIPDSCNHIGEKYMLDLPYINKYQLLAVGLREEQIEMSNICTACETEKFFSYRKEQGCSGRFMSLIGISPLVK